jgi:exodeoxyribonuclease V beta subunit
VTSFSGLASAGFARHLDDVREQDENLSSVPALAPAKETREPCLLSDFPGGTKAGNFFHSVLERIAFDDLSDEALHPQVERGLQQYGFSAPTWTATVSDAVRSMMTTQLGVGSEAFCLAEVDGWLPEFAFHIPLGQAKVAQVVASQLADVLRAHPSERLLPSYADRLERLGFAPVEGLLKGYIDLVMRKDGRWYLADYKSNYLGEDMDAYRADRLPAAMAHGLYYLQAHLYCVALQRYLECRLSDYDYDLHFGGVHYLFLRGMRSTTGPSHGVFFERPPKGRIEALSRVLAGTRGEKR